MFTKWRLVWAVATVVSAAPGAISQDAVFPRGPVHEAFLQRFASSAGPGQAVAKEPPAAVVEMPPEERPPGDNVQWVGGYWSWDQGRQDFVWIGGTYRDAPPGRQYVA